MKKQPAYKSYVFDQGYRDVGRAFRNTWARIFDRYSIRRLFERPILFLPNAIAFTVITFFRIIVNIAFSLVLIALFSSAAVVVYAGFVLVKFFDFIYRKLKRISSVCSVCQYRYDLPYYDCPSCGRTHTRLIPSQYGIFKRTCECGKKLPTTFFNGRHKLKAICPNCGVGIRDGGKHKHIYIPVIGGISAGKTCFIHMAIEQIEQKFAGSKQCQFSMVNDGSNDHEYVMKGMKGGYVPDKTGETRLTDYQFYLTPKGERVKRLISICDVSGELYADEQTLGDQIGFRYANAFIMVIDPLSISAYQREVKKQPMFSRYHASPMEIDDIMSRLVMTLENFYASSSRTKIEPDLAIVFTKCDFPGLDQKIGKNAVGNYLRNHAVSEQEARNILCESFLNEYEEGNFVNNVKSKFKKVQYFTCTSLGDITAKSFRPDGVEEPVLWLINREK